MGHFAYLAPVGPFAGLSKPARQKIGDRFPALPLAHVESAAEAFLIDLEAPGIGPRLSEARDQLNIFAKEIARFHGAVNQVRKHRLDRAVGEASRLISGKDELKELERLLDVLRTAIRKMSRALPPGRPELACRRFVATLAGLLESAGGTEGDSLVRLVELVFDDLMVGGDAATAVREWRHGQAAEIDHERASVLLELVP